MQWAALATIEGKRSKIEGGNGRELLSAVREVLTAGVAAPEWLATEFATRYWRAIHYDFATWDEAFGRLHKKGLKLQAAKIREDRWVQVVTRIQEILKTENVAIDDGLFERVAADLGFGQRQVKELWYRMPMAVRGRRRYKKFPRKM